MGLCESSESLSETKSKVRPKKNSPGPDPTDHVHDESLTRTALTDGRTD